MASTLNVKLLGVFLIVFNHYDCLVQSPVPELPTSGSNILPFLRNSIQIPDFARDLSIQKLVDDGFSSGLASQMGKSSIRQILKQIADSLQGLFDATAVPPIACTYITGVLTEAQTRAGQFSANAPSPYVKGAGDRVLSTLKSVIDQIPSCKTSPNVMLAFITQQLKKYPINDLKIESDVITGNDVALALGSALQKLQAIGDKMDIPLSQILKELILRELVERLGDYGTKNFSDVVSGFTTDAADRFQQFSSFMQPGNFLSGQPGNFLSGLSNQ